MFIIDMDILIWMFQSALSYAGCPGNAISSATVRWIRGKSETVHLSASSMTCLAGDVIGDYSFEKPVQIGDRLVFEDMAIYSMVKNNTFNGMPLPGIALLRENGTQKW